MPVATKLTEKDRDLLLALYEMPHWAAFRRFFLEERQMELAQLAVFAPDFPQLSETRGKVIELKNIEISMKKLYDSGAKQEKITNG